MSLLERIVAWWRTDADPETRAEAERVREERRLKTSNPRGAGGLRGPAGPWEPLRRRRGRD